MEELPFIIYRALVTALPGLLVYAIFSKYRKKHTLPKGRESVVSVLVLSVYVMLVFYVTDVGTVFDLLRHGFEYYPNRINLIPFLLDSYPMQYALNVVMFVPLGFLIPYLWPSTAKSMYVIAYGLGFSFLIELSQLLNHRATDVDDLLMNTLGAAIGYAIFALVRKIRKSNNPDPLSSNSMPAVYLGAMFAGNFFLCDSLGLAKVLYGF